MLSALDPTNSGAIAIHEIRDLVEHCVAPPKRRNIEAALGCESATLSVSGVMPGRGGGAHMSDGLLERAARLIRRPNGPTGSLGGGLGLCRGAVEGPGSCAIALGLRASAAAVAMSCDGSADGHAIGLAAVSIADEAELNALPTADRNANKQTAAECDLAQSEAAVDWSGRWPGRGGGTMGLGREEPTPFEAEGSTPHDVARAEAAAQRTASPSVPMMRDLPLPKLVGEPIDAHGALRQLQQQRIRELLQHVAALIEVQSQLEQSHPAVLHAMPELRFDRVPLSHACDRA